MKTLQLYFLIIALACLSACGSKESKKEVAEGDKTSTANIAMPDENALKSITLDDSKVKSYMETLKKLKTKGADLSNDVNELNAIFKYKELENVVQEDGFKDFNEFILVHTKIAYAMVASEMKDQNVEGKMQDAQNEGIKKIEESLKDPNLTPEAKAALEQTLEQLKGMGDMGKQMNTAMDMYKNAVTESDMNIVKKYAEELKKVYESSN